MKRWLKWCSLLAAGVGLVIGVAWVWCNWECNWESWQGMDSQGAAVRNLALILGSLAALGLAVWRSWIAQQQLTHHQRSLLNDRYQRAAEMLGSNAMAVRLGGIDALEQLSLGHPQDYHVQVMRLFSAFVRHPPHPPPPELTGEILPRDNDDVQAIARCLCRRDESRIDMEADYCFDLRGAHLQDAVLTNVNLNRADMSGARLSGARLIGAKLVSTSLRKAYLDRACLSHADLRRADIGEANFVMTNLQGALLEDADLRGATGLTQEQLDETVWDPKGPLLDVLEWKPEEARSRPRSSPAPPSPRSIRSISG